MSSENDLDNTRQYIRLFQMQLHGVLEDMAKPAETLSGQFSDALINLYSIREHLVDDNEINREELSEMVETLIKQMFECVSSMQFVDAKRQRIEHVADGLDYLIDIDSGTNQIVTDWDDVKNRIQKQYTMDKERNIYKKYLQEFDCNNEVENFNTAN
ncbi:MAG: hypothetical protein AB8B89_02270 [Gammaproteobacteria bacterium]